MLCGLTSVVIGLGACAHGYADDAAPPSAMQSVSVCPPVPTGEARCFTELVVAGGPAPGFSRSGRLVAPAGFSPDQIKSAYDFPTDRRAGNGQTIAIVVAYDAPTAEKDLKIFSKQFGLRLCTSDNGCFKKVDKLGGTSYPPVDAGWAVEASLDVQWAHAIAPGADILLVEASSASFVDLFAAFHYAIQHASYVSCSWGGAEFALQTVFDPLFVFPGVSEFFASGDLGAALPSFPSTSPEVVAVGGTRLKLKPSGKVRKETGWSGSGGGCSTIYDASTAQSGFGANQASGCGTRRAIPDLSLVGDPTTGVAIYIGTPFQGVVGWSIGSGTSASTPIAAARAAISGEVFDAATVYSDRPYRDIVKGNNGFAAGIGYDLVTGRGAPVH